jgi:peptide/nickel transport system substrate-binding protein
MARRGQLAWLGVLALVGIVVAAAPADATDATRAIRVVVPEGPTVLDPHLDPTSVGSSIYGNIFETLLTSDAASDNRPVLALRWEQEGALAWRFELRPGVRFHNGAEMTSADVVASFLRARDHERSVPKVLLSDVAKVSADGPLAVRFEVSKPDAVVLAKLANVAIVPRSAGTELGEPIGTGPYRVVRSDPGKSVTLEAFDGYWGAKPSVPKVELRFERDRALMVKSLLNGDVDLVAVISPEAAKEIEKRDDLWVDSALGSFVFILGLNANLPPFDDPIVREAVDYALDRQEIARAVFLNHARPAGQLVNNTARGYAPSVAPVNRDLVRAKALLSTAGSSKPVAFSLEFVQGGEKYAREVQRQLAEAGFRVELKPRSWPELLSGMLEGKAQSALFTWSNQPADSGFTFDIIVHSGSSSTLKFGVATPDTDRLIDAARTTLDPLARLALLHSIAERIAQRRTMLPLVWSMDLYGSRREITWEPQTSGEIRFATIRRRPR